MQGKLEAALGHLGYPIMLEWTGGGEDTYFTYNEIRTPVQPADNRPMGVRTTLMLHLFCPKDRNPAGDIRRVERALHGAGFSWPQTTVLSENAPDCRHVIFQCRTVEIVKGD